MTDQLKKSVEIVGSAWASSPYYDDAERWTTIFWSERTTFRRLFDHLDLRFVIELACGHGRHAEQIVQRAGHVALMDIHEANLDFCRRRLAAHSNASYHLNSGFDFQPIAEGQASSIFCYDAMVHFSPDLVSAYLRDSARVLTAGGHALFHHSNYPAPLDRHYGQNPHARNHMTKELFATLAEQAGLVVVESVSMTWGHDADLDCISLVRRP